MIRCLELRYHLHIVQAANHHLPWQACWGEHFFKKRGWMPAAWQNQLDLEDVCFLELVRDTTVRNGSLLEAVGRALKLEPEDLDL